jgi:hypothetical protein
MVPGAHRASSVVAIVALLAGAAGCRRPATPAPVGLLLVRSADLAPAMAEAGIDLRAATDVARAALGDAGFSIDEGARRSYRATLEVVAFSTVRGSLGRGPDAEVVAELRLEPGWTSGPVLRRVGKSRASLSGSARAKAWREALRGAVQEAAQGLALDLTAAAKSTEALVGDLGAADADVRERAIRTLASRGARETAPALGRLVHDPAAPVAAAAVDALVSFKDRGSALALIEAAQAGDAGTTLRLLPILAELGGADVEGYLLALRAGHADPAVRQAAAEALGRLRPTAPPTARKR